MNINNARLAKIVIHFALLGMIVSSVRKSKQRATVDVPASTATLRTRFRRAYIDGIREPKDYFTFNERDPEQQQETAA
jgi:hypothetical protein